MFPGNGHRFTAGGLARLLPWTGVRSGGALANTLTGERIDANRVKVCSHVVTF